MYGLLIDMFVAIMKCIYTQVLMIVKADGSLGIDFRVSIEFDVKLWQHG